jgi:BirA family biotin operon repressor/biotin-[acetyl-CoA-carboxylase] ligase
MPEPAPHRRARPAAPPGEGAWDIRSFASIDSTNRYLLDEARAGAPDGVVAVADHQVAGRGRLGRTWEAAPGTALLVSVLLRPALAADRLGLVTMAAGVALAEAVEAVAGVRAALKWPNDLVVGERKVAGLLAEAELAGGAVRAVVVGVGCNLGAGAYPPELAHTATAIEVAAGRSVARDLLLDAFLDALDRRVADVGGVVDAYRRRSATLGRRVRVELGADRALTGAAVAVTEAGALVVRDDTGIEHVLAAGDVVHLRPVADA